MILPYGYIDQFAGVSFNTANIKPMRCRLRTPSSARVITLANGRAFNAGAPALSGIYPVEQVLDVLLMGNAPGGGLVLDTIVQTIAAKQGQEATLRVRVPAGGRFYSTTAILDYIEIVNEGQMNDSDVINWSVLSLHFFQLVDFTVV